MVSLSWFFGRRVEVRVLETLPDQSLFRCESLGVERELGRQEYNRSMRLYVYGSVQIWMTLFNDIHCFPLPRSPLTFSVIWYYVQTVETSLSSLPTYVSQSLSLREDFFKVDPVSFQELGFRYNFLRVQNVLDIRVHSDGTNGKLTLVDTLHTRHVSHDVNLEPSTSVVS